MELESILQMHSTLWFVWWYPSLVAQAVACRRPESREVTSYILVNSVTEAICTDEYVFNKNATLARFIRESAGLGTHAELTLEEKLQIDLVQTEAYGEIPRFALSHPGHQENLCSDLHLIVRRFRASPRR